MKTKPTEESIIKDHYRELGKKAALVNKLKGSAYFKWVRSHYKRKPKDIEEQ